MRDKRACVDLVILDQIKNVGHILGNATCSSDNVDTVIVNAIEIQATGHIVNGRTCKEIDASVLARDLLGHSEESRNRHHNEHVVKAAVGNLFQVLYGVFKVSGIDKLQIYAFFLCFRGIAHLCGVVKAILVQIGNNHLRYAGITHSQFHATNTHRTCAAENGDTTACFSAVCTHIVGVIGVIEALIAADAASERLCKRACKIAIALIRKQTAALQDDLGNYRVLCVSADIRIGIAGIMAVWQLQGGLNNDLLTLLPIILYIFADRNDLAAHFVADDDGIFRYIIRHALMGAALLNSFICRSANRVADYTDQYLVSGNLGQLKFFQADIIHSIQTNSFCFHFYTSIQN